MSNVLELPEGAVRDTCRSCGDPIIFVVMCRTRERMPLNLRANDDGNVIYPWGYDLGQDVWLARVERKDELDAFKGKQLLWMPHFATCRAAEAMRNRRAKAKR